jgi:hypothetical protein
LNRRIRILVVAGASLTACFTAHPARVSAQTAGDSTLAPSGPPLTVTVGEHYRAGRFHRFLLGADYRRLWTTPVQIPQLDLRGFAGGLRPVRRVGGQQTLGLAMKGADGRDYTFRGLDKDPSEILPPEYRGTFVDDLLQDQIASSFPGGALAVAPLMQAAGVLHTTPFLVVMPDDSLLGEFRETFAGVPGSFEEYPRPAGDGNPGFRGATEIINGAEMWRHMDESPATRPDSRAFLTARLVDILVGDWDRHRGQWHWAMFPGEKQWQPIPEDRDQAFVRFEGLIATAGRQHLPQFVSFAEKYPSIEGLTWNGRDGDRRILVDLERPAWEQAATELKARITDDVIASAVGRIPDAYREKEGAALERSLRSRRDALPEVTDAFYRFLAHDVDVRATDQSERVAVSRMENGDVAVSVALARREGTLGEAPYYQRTFHPDETSEVRIYLGGGADTLVASGHRGKITVRVIGGDGTDFIDDSAGTGLRVSDADGDTRVLRGAGTRLDTRQYTPPKREKAEWIPPRDWGRRNVFIPWIGGNSDLGFLFLATLESEGYGFRKDPFADRQTYRLGYATRAGAFGADYRGDFRHENSRTRTGIYARASGLDFLHFYGYGNQTAADEDEDYYKVKHTQYVLEPSLTTPFGSHWTATLRANAQYGKTDLNEDHYIASAPPYGTEDFFQVAVGTGIAFDTRDSGVAPTSGFHLSADGNVFPEVGAVTSTFGEIHGEAAYYQPIPVGSTPTLALRAGGKQVWGTYPWHEAAYIGGARSVRGFAQQRFAGDAALYGSAELRIPLAGIYVFVPGHIGVFGLADAGRVFLEGEDSRRWHAAGGGGLWLSFVSPENTISFYAAASDEGTRFYLHAGFAY